ncbi:SUKH-4 family immunity protein [Streptomyces sp. 142MFCol3.1]|uniref:SUKH-4 family immunity protein n=1 Tax=Streptomyces sp. 142MFCol3.1 TaxID=1172179 RepID=UPI00048D7E55|nr:SUKH-4 family immunity protein [Streptomyces sp. 142MFCol3.1]
MSTTDTGVGGAITLTDDELDPYVTHTGTRHLLTGPGLPHDGALLAFGALREHGLRRLADLAGDADRLAGQLRDQVVVGALRSLDRDLESIVLDGTTGRVSTTCIGGHRAPMDLTPLAPSLEALLRFAAVTEELSSPRGRFGPKTAFGLETTPAAPASRGQFGNTTAATELAPPRGGSGAATAELTSSRDPFGFGATAAGLAPPRGRFGPKAVMEASERLSAVFAEAAGDRVPPFWRMAALIRPLTRIAGPGDGLVLDLPKRLLDEEFGAGGIMRFEDVDFPSALTHEPTRRFLRETGLPEDGLLFQLDTEVPLPALTEYYADERPGEFFADELPATADRLIRLGHLVEDISLVVDGGTGAVLAWSEPDLTLRPLNADISTLAFTLWLLHREKALDAAHDLSDTYEQLAATMSQTLATVDPVACDPTPALPGDDGRRYWPEAFDDQAGGVLYA